MEPENSNIEEQVIEEKPSVNNLNTVTPLSKYLAMLLFIILPFLGGWIGYQYAPEKVVEVERVTVQEVSSEKKDHLKKWELPEFNIDLPNSWVVVPDNGKSLGHGVYDIQDELGVVKITISSTENLAAYSMQAPLEMRTSLAEALKFELHGIKEIKVGGLDAYSGYSVNDAIDYVSKEVWVQHEDERVYMFNFDPEDYENVSKALENIEWKVK